MRTPLLKKLAADLIVVNGGAGRKPGFVVFTAIRYFDYVIVCPLLVLDLLWNLESPYKWCAPRRRTGLCTTPNLEREIAQVTTNDIFAIKCRRH